MTAVTQILARIQDGDAAASEELMPLVYHELRQLAASRLAKEQSPTLQPTELVHEAYLRLVSPESSTDWDNRGHFFSAAAEAMRRILIDRARARSRTKREHEKAIVDFDVAFVATEDRVDEMLQINEAITALEQHDQMAADMVKLRFFVGMQHREVAQALGITKRQADRVWIVARTWLFRQLNSDK